MKTQQTKQTNNKNKTPKKKNKQNKEKKNTTNKTNKKQKENTKENQINCVYLSVYQKLKARFSFFSPYILYKRKFLISTTNNDAKFYL